MLVVVAAAVSVAAYTVRPQRARSFALLHGSMFLADQKAPVGVDLASGKPTLRLVGAEKQVGARSPNELAVVPLTDATLLVDEYTGQFNMVDSTGFVIKHDNGGVPLPARSDATTSSGVAAGVNAYLERTGPAGTDIYLVDQSTVQAATDLNQGVAPRASTRVRATGSTMPGSMAVADGTFWTLLDSGGKHSLHEFSVPAGAQRGARLRDSLRATISGPTAVAAAGANAAASARNGATTPAAAPTPDSTSLSSDAAVGVATADAIRYFGASTRPTGREITYRPVAGLDRVLAATSASDRLVFLLHGDTGWSVVSLARNGTRLRGPTALTGVPQSANLAPPAMSEGAAYTVDRTSGALYRIGLDGKTMPVAGAAHYPLAHGDGRVVELASFGDAYVTAHGPRVFVDSPTHVDAVALFTDGSRKPLIIRKSDAVDVSAAAGAQALARGDTSRTAARSGQSRPKATGQAINNRVDCRTVDQKPLIPVITQATPGSRSVALAWNYPLLDSQDCAPTTYVVSVKLLGGDARQPGGTATVQGQQSTNVTGLYPLSRYRMTVTAYLHGVGATSAPVDVTTGKAGPPAPTDVRATADADGNWQVNFNSCGPAVNGCLPAATWRVVASFCDGVGLSTPPAPIVVSADPDAVAQPTVSVHGSDDLLGRGLSFQVEGTGSGGEVGTPSTQSSCVYSHTAPSTSALVLHASTPAHVALGSDTSTDLALSLGNDPTRALGGYGAQVTFTLSGGGTTRTRGPITFDGTQSTLSTVIDGVRAGTSYTATATVSAPHGGGTTQVSSDGITTRADWPATSLSASCPSDTDSLSCSLHVTVGGIASADANGETFDFHGHLTCGNTDADIDDTDFDPANHTIVVSGLSQLSGFYGTCQVSGTLSEHDPGGNAVFAGTSTSPSGTSINLGTAQSGDATFSASWDPSSAAADVTTDAASSNFARLTTNWKETLFAPDGTTVCGRAADPATPEATVPIDPSTDCLNDYGGTTGWTVLITYDEQIGGAHHTATASITQGQPNGYVPPCSVDSSNFTAAWGATLGDGVHASYTGPGSDLAGCDTFTYQLQDATSAACSDPVSVADPTQDTEVDPYASCTPSDGWTVLIKWHDQRTAADDSTTVPLGSPPSS